MASAVGQSPKSGSSDSSVACAAANLRDEPVQTADAGRVEREIRGRERRGHRDAELDRVGDHHAPQPGCRGEDDRHDGANRERFRARPAEQHARDLHGGEVDAGDDEAVEEQAEVDRAKAADERGGLPRVAQLVELEVGEHAAAAPQGARRKTPSPCPVSRNDHHTQFSATPPSRTRFVTRFGVSVENVVATSEMPISHHGAWRPAAKNSVMLRPARRASTIAGTKRHAEREHDDDPIQRRQMHGSRVRLWARHAPRCRSIAHAAIDLTQDTEACGSYGRSAERRHPRRGARHQRRIGHERLADLRRRRRHDRRRDREPGRHREFGRGRVLDGGGRIRLDAGTSRSARARARVRASRLSRRRRRAWPASKRAFMEKASRSRPHRRPPSISATTTGNRPELFSRIVLGINPSDLGSPWVAAVASLLTFAIGALVPLIPWYFTDAARAPIVSLAGALLAAFVIGALLGYHTDRRWLRGGVRQVVVITLASAITYGVGHLFHGNVA